jgi:hypothetical protein
MDLFNVLYWAYDDGRYTEWGSVYPPLNFIFLKIINFIFAGKGFGDPALMRENSPFVIAGFCIIYLAIPALLLKTRLWRDFLFIEKILIYFIIIFSAPRLITLERGNLIVLAPVLLALALSKIGMGRSICIALLINIKPYFVLLMIYYLARRNWKGFVACTALSGLIFAISGLALDNHFLVFVTNIFDFSQATGLFSLREVMALPSSVSAFSYVLKNPDGAGFASHMLSSEHIAIVAFMIEVTKWSVLAISLAILFVRSGLMRDAEIFTLLIVTICNLGIWVGGYSFILYIALIPILTKMRARWLYIGLLSLLAIPIDVVPLLNNFIGQQYSYLADAYVNVQWTLGLGSAVRPAANLMLLMTLSFEFFMRKREGAGNFIVHLPSFVQMNVGY